MFVGLPFQRSRGRRPAGEVLRHRLLVMKEKGRGLKLRRHFVSGDELVSEVFPCDYRYAVTLCPIGVPGYLHAPV